jgi:lysophospholipase L1-like esterase
MRRFLVVAMLALWACGQVSSAPQTKPVRESIEWLDVWIPSADTDRRPRVLLIGDSITRGYYQKVEKALEGKASCARLTTSRSLGDPVLFAEIRLVLGQYPFDVIHFNNGLHGFGYTEEQYAGAFPELLAIFRKEAPKAKLVWATTTPIRTPGKLDTVAAGTERVRTRNRVAAEQLAKLRLPVNDLFSLVESHPEFYSDDGTHFNQEGISAEAAQVARYVLEALPAVRP